LKKNLKLKNEVSKEEAAALRNVPRQNVSKKSSGEAHSSALLPTLNGAVSIRQVRRRRLQQIASLDFGEWKSKVSKQNSTLDFMMAFRKRWGMCHFWA